ncbi:modular serine protease-like [Trichogramma pretiosum]|uniref:modular serine protease-like n=1 Tax=Trichogramma pretiosum TaxID=7493 RepID=UPI0006C9C188|nr:modular serine protease-like [Trichogramma pretiosum]
MRYRSPIAALWVTFSVLLASCSGQLLDDYASRPFGSSCNVQQWRCDDGQCISGEALCDGLIDCIDGSDETRKICRSPRNPPCNPRTFRCDYGACVDGDAPCNGIKDCADNSDESPSRCGGGGAGDGNNNPSIIGNVTCGVHQFRCDSGQCIHRTDMCDGNVDCNDRSDETALVCGSFSCPQTVFRCAYGACIDNDLKCNGVVNCADGSDEDRKMCGNPPAPGPNPIDPWQPKPPSTTSTTSTTTTTRRPPQPNIPVVNTCALPPQPDHGSWMLDKRQCQGNAKYSDCDLDSGVRELDAGRVILYSCHSGFRLVGNNEVFCRFEGQWSGTPTCEKITCPGLSDETKSGSCTAANGSYVPCSQPMEPGSRGDLHCNEPTYRQDTTDITRNSKVLCSPDGQWLPKPILCLPVCGQASGIDGKPLIVDGQPTTISAFPWHGTLYLDESGEKQFKCGATVIHKDLLVTASHCVYDDGRRQYRNPKKYYVAVGNTFRDYDMANQGGYVQRSQVEKFYSKCTYQGLSGNYVDDIVIIKIKQHLQFSSFVLPVCLDFRTQHENLAFEHGTLGRVAGFGRTRTGPSSAILQSLTLPYANQAQCQEENRNSDNYKFFSDSKFCAGWRNGSSVCSGDSGGGLVFKHQSKWYLRGIVSLGLVKDREDPNACEKYRYTLFERVSKHIGWIKDIIQEVTIGAAVDHTNSRSCTRD